MGRLPYIWQIFSGVCLCGHSWEDHHLGVIMNRPDDLPTDHPGYLPQECEYHGSNEMGGLGPDGEDHCHQYIDKDNTIWVWLQSQINETA